MEGIRIFKANQVVKSKGPKKADCYLEMRDEEGKVRIPLYERFGKYRFVLTDENYLLIRDFENKKIYAIETKMVTEESDIMLSCTGSHGGEKNKCSTCAFAENESTGDRTLHVDVDNCTLSKHYFGKEYWFQHRTLESALIETTAIN